jgi:hypothetical protein
MNDDRVRRRWTFRDWYKAAGMAGEQPQPPQVEPLEEIDNPLERLKLLGENEEAIGRYLDAIEVTSPREREMLHEISRTRPLARPDRFPEGHAGLVLEVQAFFFERSCIHGAAQVSRAEA